MAVIEAGKVEELRAAVPELFREAAKPAELVGIVETLKPWFATYPQTQREEAEWADWWHGYAITCGHLPTAALQGAMKAWAKRPDAEFLPKPGLLADLARQTPTAAFKIAGRAHQILQLADDRLDRERVAANMGADHVKSEDQRAAVHALLADFHAKSEPVRERGRRVLTRGIANADKPDAELPYIGGAPAPGSALTPEMLRALGRSMPKPSAAQFSEEW